MADPWFASKWAALRMLGRSHNGTNPDNMAEWQGAALNATSRSLHSLLRGNDGTTETTLRTLSNGVLRVVGQGSATSPFLQDANGAIVVTPSPYMPSMLASVHLSTGTDVLIFSAAASRVYGDLSLKLVNNHSTSANVVVSMSTAANSSRIYRGTLLAASRDEVDGFVVVNGKPLRGGGSSTQGITASLFGRRLV